MTAIPTLVARLGAAGCLAASGIIHAQLYLDGYHVIPWIGPAFLLQAGGAIAVAVLLLITSAVVPALAGAAVAAGALGGFVLSRTVGVMGFVEHGWQPAPQALLSVLAEVAALGLLAAPLLSRATTSRLVTRSRSTA